METALRLNTMQKRAGEHVAQSVGRTDIYSQKRNDYVFSTPVCTHVFVGMHVCLCCLCLCEQPLSIDAWKHPYMSTSPAIEQCLESKRVKVILPTLKNVVSALSWIQWWLPELYQEELDFVRFKLSGYHFYQPIKHWPLYVAVANLIYFKTSWAIL